MNLDALCTYPGYYANNDGKLSSNKTITISILNHIPVGLKSEEFQKKIEDDLYSELDKIR